MLNDVIISIFDYEKRKKQEGILEGQLRDIGMALLGSMSLSHLIVKL